MRSSSGKGFFPLVARRSARHSIRGVDYHVSEWGEPSSPLLVLLHGFGDAGSTFQFLVDELENDWFVIAPDWRGFGDSRMSSESYWFPDYLADLEALLAIYSPNKPVNLIGHSMGGNIAGLYSGVFPERVAKFVNVEGFGLPDRDPEDAPANYRAWIDRCNALTSNTNRLETSSTTNPPNVRIVSTGVKIKCTTRNSCA